MGSRTQCPKGAILQTAGWLCGGLDGEAAAAAASARDVEVISLSRYSHGRAGREGPQLGFAAVDAKEIQRGVRELAMVLEREWKKLNRGGVRREREAEPAGRPTPENKRVGRSVRRARTAV